MDFGLFSMLTFFRNQRYCAKRATVHKTSKTLNSVTLYGLSKTCGTLTDIISLNFEKGLILNSIHISSHQTMYALKM